MLYEQHLKNAEVAECIIGKQCNIQGGKTLETSFFFN